MDKTKVTNEVHKEVEKPSSNIQSEELGKPLEIFKFDPLGDYGVLFSLVLVLGFTISLIFFWWTIRDEGMWGLFNCTTIPVLFLFLLGVSRILNWVRHRDDQVTLYENGFVYLKAAQPLELRWDEITEVEHKTFPINSRRGSYLKTSHSYYVRGENKSFIALSTNIQNVKKLGTTIQERVTERLLPTANQKIDAGEKISFGPFTLGKTELDYEDRSILWADVKEVRSEYKTKPYLIGEKVTEVSILKVFRKDDDSVWVVLDASAVPNYPLLLVLAENLILDDQP